MLMSSLMPLIFILVTITAIPQDRSALTSNCSFYYTIDQNTSSFVSCNNQQSTNQSSWATCSAYCCPSIVPSAFSVPVLQQCVSRIEQTSKSMNPLIIVIVFISIVTALIIFGLICRTCRRYMIDQQLSKIMAGLPEHERGNLTTSCKNEKWIGKTVKIDKSHSSLSDTIEDRNCSICLETKTNITLICCHEFHEDCLCEWFNKKQTCPMCRTDVNFIKVKCLDNCGRYMLMKLTDFLVAKDDLIKRCKSCLKEPKEEVKRKGEIIVK